MIPTQRYITSHTWGQVKTNECEAEKSTSPGISQEQNRSFRMWLPRRSTLGSDNTDVAPWLPLEGGTLLSSQPHLSILSPRKEHLHPLSCPHAGSTHHEHPLTLPPQGHSCTGPPEPVLSLPVPLSGLCSCVSPRPTGPESAVNAPNPSSFLSKPSQAINTGPTDCPAEFARDHASEAHTSLPHTSHRLPRH